MTVMLATLIELEAIQEELPVFPSAKEVTSNLLTPTELQWPSVTSSDLELSRHSSWYIF